VQQEAAQKLVPSGVPAGSSVPVVLIWQAPPARR